MSSNWRDKHFELRRQRPLGVVEAVGDPVLDAADQLLVLQQHQVHIQQRRSARAAPPWGPSARWCVAGDGSRRPRRCGPPHPLDLGLDLLRLDEVVRDVHPAGRHQHGTPDGDAAGDSEAVDRRRSWSAALVIRPLRTCRQSAPAKRPWPPARVRRTVSSDDLAADAGGQHHHAHDALGVDAAFAPADPDFAGISCRPAWSAWPRRGRAGPAYC